MSDRKPVSSALSSPTLTWDLFLSLYYEMSTLTVYPGSRWFSQATALLGPLGRILEAPSDITSRLFRMGFSSGRMNTLKVGLGKLMKAVGLKDPLLGGQG